MKEELFFDTTKPEPFPLIAKVLRGDWPEGIAFHTKDEFNIQVGTMSYPKGQHMKAHKHNVYPRVADRTNEAMYIVEGKIEAILLSEEGKELSQVILVTGDIAIFLGGGHSFNVLKPCKILEIKNGPYLGVEKDKTWYE